MSGTGQRDRCRTEVRTVARLPPEPDRMCGGEWVRVGVDYLASSSRRWSVLSQGTCRARLRRRRKLQRKSKPSELQLQSSQSQSQAQAQSQSQPQSQWETETPKCGPFAGDPARRVGPDGRRGCAVGAWPAHLKITAAAWNTAFRHVTTCFRTRADRDDCCGAKENRRDGHGGGDSLLAKITHIIRF